MHFVPEDVFDFKLDKTIDETVIIPEMKDPLAKMQKKEIRINVSNLNRALGTLFGAEITRKYYNTLEDDTFVVHCTGAGGQSFGACIPKGLTLALEGDSNDYFGKGLSGGKLAVFPPKGSKFKEDENIIIGNVALFGATSGKAFINGVAGERFCVRNSGATAVVEGTGDHGCEYMTGGCVVVLGPTGKNFADGMRGGIANVWNYNENFDYFCNMDSVELSLIEDSVSNKELKDLVRKHYMYTRSELAHKMLDNWNK